LLKYLLKSFKGNDDETKRKAFKQKALLWALNSRGWTVSKSLVSLKYHLMKGYEKLNSEDSKGQRTSRLHRGVSSDKFKNNYNYNLMKGYENVEFRR